MATDASYLSSTSEQNSPVLESARQIRPNLYWNKIDHVLKGHVIAVEDEILVAHPVDNL